MKRTITLSLFIHLILFITLVWIERRNPHLQNPSTPTYIILEAPSEKKGNPAPALGNPKSNRAENKKHERPTKGKEIQKPLNFGWVPKPFSGDTTPSDSNGHGKEGARSGKPDGYDYANGMGIAQEGKLYPFFDAIWHKIDSAITYPNDFSQQRIKGQVTLQLTVDRRGVFTGEIRSVRGSEPLLEAFVLATVIHALKTPLPENSWMNRRDPQAPDHVLLVTQFDFDLFGPGGHPRDVEYSHLKNIMNFRRDSYVDPKLNQMIEKFFSRTMPAIIPIPGGFFIDFYRAYQFFKNLAAPTPDEDELRVRRLQMNQEQWDSVVQKESR